MQEYTTNMDKNDPINFYHYDRLQQLKALEEHNMESQKPSILQYVAKIRQWAVDRNILKITYQKDGETTFDFPEGGGTLLGQARKLVEEAQEALEAAAVIEAFDRLFTDYSHAEGGDEYLNARDLLRDAIGDTFIVLCILSAGADVALTACIEEAWHEIKNRKGRMINGKFVKAADLPDDDIPDLGTDPAYFDEDSVSYCVSTNYSDGKENSFIAGPFKDYDQACRVGAEFFGIVWRLTQHTKMISKDFRVGEDSGTGDK